MMSVPILGGLRALAAALSGFRDQQSAPSGRHTKWPKQKAQYWSTVQVAPPHAPVFPPPVPGIPPAPPAPPLLEPPAPEPPTPGEPATPPEPPAAIAPP